MKIMNERNDKFSQKQHVSQQSACANVLLQMAAGSLVLIASYYSCHRQAASGSFISTCFLIPVAMFCLTPLNSVELQSCESLKADSHIACRAHAAPMPFPCHAVPLRI